MGRAVVIDVRVLPDTWHASVARVGEGGDLRSPRASTRFVSGNFERARPVLSYARSSAPARGGVCGHPLFAARVVVCCSAGLRLTSRLAGGLLCFGWEGWQTEQAEKTTTAQRKEKES
jgi:hypothetical protein